MCYLKNIFIILIFILDKQSFFAFPSTKGHVKEHSGNTLNLGQKSLQLYRFILEHYTSPYGVVLELFAGTATLNRAAMSSRRSCISIELLQKDYDAGVSLCLNHRDALMSKFKDKPILLASIERPLFVNSFQNEVAQYWEQLKEKHDHEVQEEKKKAKEQEQAKKAEDKAAKQAEKEAKKAEKAVSAKNKSE